MVKVPIDLCLRCKGARHLCGLGYCPLLQSFRSRVVSLQSIKGLEVDGSTPPSLIVGEKGYPRINIYFNVPPGIRGDEAKIFDDPLSWHLRKGLNDIIGLRSRLLSLRLRAYTHNPYSLYEKEIGLAAISLRPVDTEARLRKKPVPRIVFDPLLPPRGPSAPVSKVKVVGNPVVPRRVDRIIWDDVRAEEAIWELYREGVDIYTIIRAFTIGFLGRKGQKRLVPTRWGITAVDSMISHKLLRRIKTYKLINDLLVFYSEYLYNKYLIVLAPSGYRGMWIEVWLPNSLWNPHAEPATLIVKEDHKGRMNIIDGGYIAA
ncbi:MAG: hypothetical protein J7K21_07020, partial [Desulfurococcales archaeon]|nr:hypothetical protein [Desulfurococcales archaeon]